jgi:hypothetical protein
MDEIDPKEPAAGDNPKKDLSSSTTKVRKSGPENREHYRFRIEDATTEIYLQGFLGRIGLGRLDPNRKNEARVAVNLSEGGLMVSTHSKLPRGSKVHLRIEMEKFRDVLEADGIVRWCYASARNATEFYTGIEFLNLPPAQIAKIAGMRAWFTSPEFKAKSATKRRTTDLEIKKGSDFEVIE